MKAAGSVVPACPQCGSALEFDTDKSGYGMTVEQCSANCGHWRTVGRVVRPANAPAPWGEGRAVPTPAEPRRRQRGSLRAAILAVLPTTAAEAITGGEVAARCDLSPTSVTAALQHMAVAGVVRRDPYTGSERPATGRPSQWAYWKDVA